MCGMFPTILTLSIFLVFDHNYTNYVPPISTVSYKGGSGWKLDLLFRVSKCLGNKSFVGDILKLCKMIRIQCANSLELNE